MQLVPAPQRTDRPDGFPDVIDPVNATLKIPLYYVNDDKKPPQRWNHPAFVSRIFANTVLAALETSLEPSGYGIAHVGIYSARYARRADGTEITPRRFSNHGLGLALDFKGLVDIHGHYTSYQNIITMGKTTIMALIIEPVTLAIEKAGRKPEIKDESGWLHIGIWP